MFEGRNRSHVQVCMRDGDCLSLFIGIYCCQQDHAGRKTLLQRNPPVLNWGPAIAGCPL